MVYKLTIWSTNRYKFYFAGHKLSISVEILKIKCNILVFYDTFVVLKIPH